MKKYIIVTAAVLASITSRSQDFLGFVNSNYSGITGSIINPANIVDSRMLFDMNLVSVNMNFGNNYIGLKHSALNHSGKLFDGLSNTKLFDQKSTDPKAIYFPAFNDPNFQQNYLTEINNDQTKSVYIAARIMGPSFMISLNHKNAIGFVSNARSYVNVDGVGAELARLLYYDVGRGVGGNSVQSLLHKQFENKYFSANTMAWLEYGLSYAHVFREKDEHYFKAGATVKYLQGIAAAYVNIKDLSYKFNNDTILGIFKTDVNYGHSENLEIPNNVKNKTNQNVNPIVDDPTLLGTFSGGYPNAVGEPGFGFDFGAVYEYRPKYKDYKYEMDGEKDLWRRDQNKYKLKIGVSLTDVGGIRYSKGKYSNNFSINTDSIRFRSFKTDSFPVQSYDKIIDSLAAQSLKTGITQKPIAGTFTTRLPMALSFQIDYNIWKDFYVNLTPYIAFQFKESEAKVHDWTIISLTPRWDHKWFGVSIPISYNTFSAKNNQPINVGASVRLGPLAFGSNNLVTYLSPGKDIFQANFYLLLKVPIPYSKPHDKDKDHVSDKKDKCKTVPGVWEFMGCPDRDGDHIQDSEDKCPDVPGIKELQGCPDRDGDGITDLEDDCPDDKGTVEFKGCPDRDGDKIIDKLDSCPDIAGLKEFDGCPDRDGDGTPDKTDLCPDIPGPKEYKGCPDRDGDTVLDKDDACPDVPGPVENKGCPWPDTDKDGIFDKDDACPTKAGVKEYKGCPPPPPIKAAEQKIIERAFQSLEFATAKDIIKPKSFPSLNDLAKLLKQHAEEWTLKLSGHTDNQGSPDKNMLLSEKRANAVKRYLVTKGAKADKILTEWFGQTAPIADNATPAGRQKNRRVEMKILFKEEVK